MNQKSRMIAGLGVLVVMVALVMGVDAYRRSTAAQPALVVDSEANVTAPAITLTAGSIPVYLDGQLAAGFSPNELGPLQKVSFVEPVEGKTEEGWLLRDVILLYIQPDQLQQETQVVVSSSSRNKFAQLTWAEIADEENMVMFDLSGRGTLKLASKLEKLDTREEWVQDVDKIDIASAAGVAP